MAGPLSRWTLIDNQGTSWNYDQTSLSSWAKLRMILVMSRVLWVSSSSQTSSTVLQLNCSSSWIQQPHIFFFWKQGLPCRYLSCWSFRDGLMPRLSSVLTTSTWVSIVKSVNLDIKKWSGKSPELHFFATMKQLVRLFDWMHPNKGDRTVKHLAISKQTNKSDYRRPCHLAQSNTQEKTKSKEAKLKWLEIDYFLPTINSYRYILW